MLLLRMILLINIFCLAKRGGDDPGTVSPPRIKLIEDRTSVAAGPWPPLGRVQVDGRIRGDVCAYPGPSTTTRPRRPNEPRTAAAVGRAYAFHAVVNCKAAEWTANRLRDLVASTPLLYQHGFRARGRYDDRYGRRFADGLQSLARDVLDAEKTGRLTDALNRLLRDAAALGSRQTDAAPVLKTLLSLTARALRARNPSDGDRHHEQLRLLLVDMTGVQRFLAMSCGGPDAAGDATDSRLYGFWTTADGGRDEALAALDGTLQQRQPRCSAERTLRPERFIDVKNGEETARAVADALVITQSDRRVTIRSVLETIARYVDDVDAVFWYYDSAVMAVVKLAVDEMRECVGRWSEFGKDVQAACSEMSAAGFADDAPAYLTDGIAVLSAAADDGGHYADGDAARRRRRLDDYYDSLIGVKLSGPRAAGCDGDSPSRIRNRLQFVRNKIPDLTCFYAVFKSVQLEHYRYYVPFAQNKRSLAGKDGRSTGCDFVRGVYAVAYKAHFLLNKYADSVRSADGGGPAAPQYLSASLDAVRNVKNYFLAVVRNGRGSNGDYYATIGRRAFDVATVLVNFRPEVVGDPPEALEFRLKRVLNVIMNEMNGYETEHCGDSADPTLLVFNKINFYEFGDRRVTDRSTSAFFRNDSAAGAAAADDDDDTRTADFGASIVSADYEFLSARFFYDEYVKSSDFYRTYETRIKVNWRGTVRTLDEIFAGESSLILNPLHFYQLYDTFFKYCAAVIFYPIRRTLLNASKLKRIRADFGEIARKLRRQDGGSWTAGFPREMKHFLSDVDRLLKLPTELAEKNPKIKDGEATGRLLRLKDDIEIRFGKSDVVFKNTTAVKKTLFRNLQYFGRGKNDLDDYVDVFDELFTKLELVSDNFSKIYHDTSILTRRYHDERPGNDDEDKTADEIREVPTTCRGREREKLRRYYTGKK